MITIDNYEEYFLDYCEGNLDAEGRREVMSFVKAHPYLREELEEFAGCPVLDDETDKAVETPANLADSLRHTSDYDEPDVPYFDRLAVLNLEKIATPAEQLEYSRMKYESIECSRVAKLYSKTILPAEQIECPDKRRMMVFPIWRRLIPYAAAAAVVGLIVWFSIGNDAAVTITSPAAPTVAVDDLRPATEPVTPAVEVVEVNDNVQNNAANNNAQNNVAKNNVSNNVVKTNIPNNVANNNVPNKAANIIDGVINNVDESMSEEVLGNDKAVVEVETVEVVTDDEASSVPQVADESSAMQDSAAVVAVELLPFDDLTDAFDNDDNSYLNKNKTKQRRHRKKFWFACGKAIKYVTRRFMPNLYFDVDHDDDGRISRVAMYAQNKVYTLQRKESKEDTEM